MAQSSPHKTGRQCRVSILSSFAGVVENPIITRLQDHPNTLTRKLAQSSPNGSLKWVKHYSADAIGVAAPERNAKPACCAGVARSHS